MYWMYMTFSQRSGRTKRRAGWPIYFLTSPKLLSLPIFSTRLELRRLRCAHDDERVMDNGNGWKSIKRAQATQRVEGTESMETPLPRPVCSFSGNPDYSAADAGSRVAGRL
jgi:hypothetical protein